MKLLDVLVPTYVQLLEALSAWLDKAQAQKPGDEADALLTARLAPDMFPLSTQVRFACVQAQEGMFRLRGRAFPDSIEILLNEGRNASERSGSIADARARIDETISVVTALAEEATDVDPNSPIAHSLPSGMIFDLSAERYARDWALPQFYFHIMIAYAILRSEGVDLGKVDYIAHMLAHIRPGTMPVLR
jgi:uncharacterized protein